MDKTSESGEWVVVHGDGKLIIAKQHTGQTSSIHTIEVFKTKALAVSRVVSLGYKMPIQKTNAEEKAIARSK